VTKLLALAAVALLAAWLFRRALPHDAFAPLPNVVDDTDWAGW